MTSTPSTGPTPAATRCPACQTVFRVTGTQLDQRGGQVRCGRCLTVFNALEHRLEQDNVVPPPAGGEIAGAGSGSGVHPPPPDDDSGLPVESRSDESEGIGQDDNGEVAVVAQALPGADAMPSFLHEPAEPGTSPEAGTTEDTSTGGREPSGLVPEPDHADSPVETDGLADRQAPAADTSLQSAEDPARPADAEADEPLPVSHSAAETNDQEAASLPALAPMVEAPAPAGLASAWSYSQERQRKPARTLPRWLGHLLWPSLGLLMLGQATFHFRGDIALLFPQLRPALSAACAALDCTLPLPRRSDLLSIESSELQADTSAAGVMVLAVTVRNKAPFAQDPPALELTLTDVQEQAVARRVIPAAEYLPRALPGPAGSTATEDMFPAGAELTLRIRFDASTLPAAGYRLYLFHP